MKIQLDLDNLKARCAATLAALVVFVGLANLILAEFITGTFADSRFELGGPLLESAARRYPDSARLHFRLAETAFVREPPDLAAAENHARQAVTHSPLDYQYRLLLGKILEAAGDLPGAEQALGEALNLAPNYSEIHWQAANLLARQGKTEAAIPHLRALVRLNPSLAPAALDLGWATSGGRLAFMREIVRDDASATLELAILLVKESLFAEAAETFLAADRQTRLRSLRAAPFFDQLIAKQQIDLADRLWNELFDAAGEPNRVWNGGFETDRAAGHPHQFEWKLAESEYVQCRIDRKHARSGARSLLLEFKNRDTTRLDQEVSHLVALRPGKKYRLGFFVKTDEFQAPEGPAVVITDAAGRELVRSAPVPNGTLAWTGVNAEFTAPGGAGGPAAGFFVRIKRQPRYSYEEPTRGRIWLDDFSINETAGR